MLTNFNPHLFKKKVKKKKNVKYKKINLLMSCFVWNNFYTAYYVIPRSCMNKITLNPEPRYYGSSLNVYK